MNLNGDADARRAWADHYAAVRARIAQGRAPANAKPPAPVVLVRPVVDRPQPPRTPARALGPPALAPLTPAEIAALPVAKARPRLMKDRRLLLKLARAQQRQAHAASVAALPERFAALAAQHGTTWTAIIGQSHSVDLIRPRFEVYQALLCDGWSYSAIARACNRDHSTIMYYIKKKGPEHGKD
jgi:hypothetical protein